MQEIILHHPSDSDVSRTMNKGEISSVEPLLVDIIKDGKICYSFASIEELRLRRESDLEYLEPGIKRIINPHRYHVSLSDRLWNLREDLINQQKHY